MRYLVAVAALVAIAGVTPANDTADEQIVLHFPTDRSMGEVTTYIPFDDVEDVESVDALGEVRIKADNKRNVVLFLTQPGIKDLSLLPALAKEGLANIAFLGVQVDDQILDALVKIPELRGLAMHGSGLTVSDIPKLTRFKQLTRLGLDIALSDQQVDAFTVLEHLKEFGFQQTQLTEGAWSSFIRMKSLRYLNLGDNLATVNGLSRLKELPALERLDLSMRGDISGAMMHQIAAAKSLKQLGLYGTIKVDALEPLNSMSQLESLNMPALATPSDAMSQLGGLKSLRHLLAPLTSGGLANIEQCKSLRSLRIAAYQSIGPEVKRLSSLEHLERVSLNGFGITDEAVKSVVDLPRLRRLDITHSSVTDQGIAAVARAKKLTTLSISGQKITDESIRHLAALPALHDLSIRDITLTRPRLLHLGALRQLKSLALGLVSKNGPTLTDADLAELKGLDRLSKLRLTELDLTDAGVKHVAQIENLGTLWLRNRGLPLTDAALVDLAGMKNLRIAEISGNFSDEGLRVLMNARSLNTLTIASPTVTDESLERLRSKMTVIDWNKRRTRASSSGGQ